MNPQENAPIAAATVMPPVKIGKFKASLMIVKESFEILKQDKEMLWFPVLSAIVSIIALIIMGSIFFFVGMGGNIHYFANTGKSAINILSYIILFVYYLVMYMITNFFLVGIYTIGHGRFNGQNLTFSDGIRGAMSNLGKIFVWSAISSTVGIILHAIGSKKGIGKFIAAILGTAWNILTFFSLPSLVIGHSSIMGSFKDSASIIRKTWGETLIVKFGAGFFFRILSFLGILLAIGIMIAVPVKQIIILVGILLIIFITALTIISSTLGSIFKLALYEYAKNGVVPKGFTPMLVENAVSSK